MEKRHFVGALVLAGTLSATIASACIPASAAVGKAANRMGRSPNRRDGKFVNPAPMAHMPVLKSLVEWIKGQAHTKPDNPVPVKRRSREEFTRLPESGLRITWIAHSTSLIEIDGVRILLEPVWSRRASPFSFVGNARFFEPPFDLDDLPELDAVLITHTHYDHLDEATVKALAPKGFRFIVPLGVGKYLRKWGVTEANVVELDWWESEEAKGVKVTATPARHFSARSVLMLDRDETLWCGFALAGPKHRIFYTGDTGMFTGIDEIGDKLGPFDATLVDVGAYNQLWTDAHLGPEQAVQAVERSRGGLLIPVHWGAFDLGMHGWTEPAERVIVAAANADVPLAVPKPGQSVEPSAPPAVIRWWPELPWRTAHGWHLAGSI